ncbi:hypothetical protein, partial [Streptomyces palmae]
PLHPAFQATDLPPLERAHWLLKPAGRSAGTFPPEAAVRWFTARLAEYAQAVVGRCGPAPDPTTMLADLAAGEDVVGGWWLSGDRFLSLQLIACPHRLRPEISCPNGVGKGSAGRLPGH